MRDPVIQSEDPSTGALRHVKVKLVVEDYAQERIVDVDLAVVLDKAQFPEFVHEKIDTGTALCQSSPPASLAKLWGALFEAGLVRHSARAAAECAPAVSHWS